MTDWHIQVILFFLISCVGARIRKEEDENERDERIKRIANYFSLILNEIGEDISRGLNFLINKDGLLNTPVRFAKSMLFLTKGYEENIYDVVNSAVFEENHDEIIVVKNIDIYSLCEHHIVPFFGKISIGYLPDKKVIGLSKLARIADSLARRLQLQERMTREIAAVLMEILEPRGVAVVCEAKHMCMIMRGVQKGDSSTITSCMLGEFRENSKTRDEFLRLIRN